MATIAVRFRYLTGLKRQIFRNARLTGSWDAAGRFSPVWSETAMASGIAEDGCPCFTAAVELDDAELGTRFRWGVRLDAPGAPNAWGVPTEVPDMQSTDRFREFELTSAPDSHQQDFYLTCARRLGARKVFSDTGVAPGLRFTVWAPNVRGVDVVFGKGSNGYIADDGDGIDLARPVVTLTKAVD